MPCFRHLAALAIAVMLPTAAGAYTVKGHVECPDIIREDGNDNFRTANKWWLLGYITARNYKENREVAKDVDDDAIYAIALDYCKRNQSMDWDDAGIRVYEVLGR